MEKLDIAELIEELEEYIEECKIVPFSGGKVNIVKNDVLTRLEELKEEIPSEVERSKEIVSRKDLIISEAQAKAEGIIDKAAKEAKLILNEEEIVAMANMRADEITEEAKKKSAEMIQKAQKKATEMVKKAQEEAEGIQLGAMQYTSNVLSGLEKLFTGLYEDQKTQTEALIDNLSKNLSKVKNNHAEIDTQLSMWLDSADEKKEEE